jgi:hypothetical protein
MSFSGFAVLAVGFILPSLKLSEYRVLTWPGNLILTSSFVSIHIAQLILIPRAFQGPKGRMNAETEFGFGQILVFFMILQLFIEFTSGLYR